MSVVTVTVSFQPDAAGFVSRACASCGKPFKIAPGAGSPKHVAFCPFCRFEGSRWETAAQIAYGKAYATRKVVKPHLDQLDRSLRNLERAGGRLLRVKVTGRMPALDVPPKPAERDDDMPARTTFGCCGETVRHEADTVAKFCVICGEHP